MSLFIGNVSERISKEFLIHEFSKFGPCEINYFVSLTQGKFAFLEYEYENAARNAFLSWNGRNFGGKILSIEYSQSFPKFLNKEHLKKSHQQVRFALSDSINLHTDILTTKNLSTDDPSNQGQVSDAIKERETVNECVYETKVLGLSANEISDQGTRKNCEKEAEILQESEEKGTNKCEITELGSEIFEFHGSLFKVIKVNKKKDDKSIIRCEACDRDFKKKSIKSHISSMIHKSKIR